MSNIRYGLKEVANVIFFDMDNKPKLFFDTLKVSTIENESESTEARGGQGNSKLLSWDFGRTATLTMQDALLSDTSLSMLAGTTVTKSNVKVVGREVLTVETDEVELKETPIAGSETVFEVNNGVMGNEITTFTITGNTIDFTGGVVDGEEVMVFYEYTVASGASQVTFSGSQFPAIYKVVGDTVVRGQDGIDRKMQFVIPKAKLQSGFTMTMDAENVSTFDFNLEVLADGTEQKLYDIIRLDDNING